jgi:hypothetical protein
MISKPLGEIIEIPDASLNEKLVPANDNHDLSVLSRESLEAASILAPREPASPNRLPLVITGLFCVLLGILLFAAWIH